MKPTRRFSTTAIVLLILVGAVGAYMAMTQGRGGDAPAHANFGGTWERTPDDWFGENPDDPVLPGGPMDMKEPYASQYADLKKRQAEANEAGKPLVTTSAQCLPEGMPVMMTALFPIEIIQDEKRVVVLGEYLQQVRRIILNDPMPPDDELEPMYQGHSRGHWEGDTLVVQTRRIRTDVAFYGVPHGEGVEITERFRLKAPDHLEIQVVINNPEVLNAPYHLTFEYKRSDYRILEYVCENNQIVIDKEGRATLSRE